MTLAVTALFASYMIAYFSFVYFGWQWSVEVQSAQATAMWAFVTALYGGLGLWLGVQVKA